MLQPSTATTTTPKDSMPVVDGIIDLTKSSELDLVDFKNLQICPSSLQCRPTIDIGVQDLAKNHRTLRNVWKHSSYYERSRRAFTEAVQESPSKVTKCVCLGLGSLSRMHPVDRTQSMAQLVALEFFLDILRRHDHEIPLSLIYFQDPAFNDIDRTYLSSLGYNVINSPASEDVVTEDTFLFAPFNSWDVVFATLNHAFPAFMVGNSLKLYQPCPFAKVQGVLPDLKNLRDTFYAQRKVVRLPITALMDDKDFVTNNNLLAHKDFLADNDFQVLYYRPKIRMAEGEIAEGMDGGNDGEEEDLWELGEKELIQAEKSARRKEARKAKAQDKRA